MGELQQYGEKSLGQESWSVFTAEKGPSLQTPLRGPQGHRDNLGFPKATLKGNKYIPLVMAQMVLFLETPQSRSHR